ncbi:RNA polymerase sigma factor [Soonwooa sp.]|uniref:RNA polymerase sigma factor n=1 Tax=Soonwooa sp. TaxID=1938592 RepID=UPI00261CE281|nr:RNA polymerase sigma factor [Soonwooa sp.]
MKRTNALSRKPTDLQLYELLKKGDPISIKHIDARYRRLLFWIGKQKLEDDFIVESLVQDVYLKLWLNRDSIESPFHMLCFLRFVLKRECIGYYRAPKNKFARLQYSIESFENYQDYLIGYDPAHDKENLQNQETEQERFDEVKKVLVLLAPKRRRLIELCLEYGFQYKAIATAMGSSVTSISNEVTKAINDLQKIIKGSSNNQVQKKTATTAEHSKKLTDQQTEIMKRRMEQKASFATIAKELIDL